MKLNQKEAVYNAIKEIVEFEDGDVVELSKDEKCEVVDILVDGFENNQIQLNSPQRDLKKYASGLLNNWLRKDTRMNGGTKYEIKNPGSRTGQSDDQVKNLRILKRAVTDPADIAAIDAAIAARIAELKPTQTLTVDATAIPEHLQHLVPTL